MNELIQWLALTIIIFSLMVIVYQVFKLKNHATIEETLSFERGLPTKKKKAEYKKPRIKVNDDQAYLEKVEWEKSSHRLKHS